MTMSLLRHDALVMINEVNLCRARLVLGWVTVSGLISGMTKQKCSQGLERPRRYVLNRLQKTGSVGEFETAVANYSDVSGGDCQSSITDCSVADC